MEPIGSRTFGTFETEEYDENRSRQECERIKEFVPLKIMT